METWDKSWFTQGTGTDGETKPICMRHNLSQCTSQRCAFVHCLVPLSDGSMCGSTDHKSITCPHHSRRASALGQLPPPFLATGVGRPLPKPHCVSDITEESNQHSQRTDPTLSTSPLSVTQSKHSAETTDAHAPTNCFWTPVPAAVHLCQSRPWIQTPCSEE